MKFKIIILLTVFLTIISISFNVTAADTQTNKAGEIMANKKIVNNIQKNIISEYLKSNDLNIYIDKNSFEEVTGLTYDKSLLDFDCSNAKLLYKIEGEYLDFLLNAASVSDIIQNAQMIYIIPLYHDGLYLGEGRLNINADGSLQDLSISLNPLSIVETNVKITGIFYDSIELSGAEYMAYKKEINNMQSSSVEAAIKEYGLDINKVEFYSVNNGHPHKFLSLLVQDGVMYPYTVSGHKESSGDYVYESKVYSKNDYIQILSAELAKYMDENSRGIIKTGGNIEDNEAEPVLFTTINNNKKSGIEVIKDSAPYIAIGSSVLLLGLAGYFSMKKFKRSRM